jgi:hypothetical protein
MQKCFGCDTLIEETSPFCSVCQSQRLRKHLRKKKQQDEIQAQSEALQEPEPSQVNVATSTLVAIRPPNWQNNPRRQFERLSASLTQTVPRPGYYSAILKRKRVGFKVLVVLAVLGLLVYGSGLAWFAIAHQHHNEGLGDKAPSLTITPNVAKRGQTVQLRVTGFPSLADLLVARDVEQSVQLGNSLLTSKLGPTDQIVLPVLITNAWTLGKHFIEIGDTRTNTFVSAALKVIGSGPSLPPHLQLDKTSLDLGSSYQGATTHQDLVLSNAGGGVISWIARTNQPWLKLSSPRGIFSDRQTIKVGVERMSLKAGDYQGTIAILSSAGDPMTVHVHIAVRALPANPGPVLAISSPVLSFSGMDNGKDPASQTLSITNTGSRPLHWSIAGSAPTLSVGDIALQSGKGWLDITPSSGQVAPGTSTSIHIHVHSHALLPGVYSGLLTLSSDQQALNTPQTVPVSLDLQSSCGVTANTDRMSFTVPVQQNGASKQELTLSAIPGCRGRMPWMALSMASWLSITPAGDQIERNARTKATVTVNASSLAPGTYSGMVAISTGLRTQLITAQLIVLPSSTTSTPSNLPTSVGSTPSPTVAVTTMAATQTAGLPVLKLSSSAVIFNVTQGQVNSASQIVSVINSGGGSLTWHAASETAVPSWLNITTVGSVLATGQTGQIIVNINDNGLAPDTYTARILIGATNNAGGVVQGSAQSLLVTLVVSQSTPLVQQPCVLQVTPGNLTFSSSLLQSNPSPQSIMVQEMGNCAPDVSWVASMNQSWLQLSRTTGSNSGTITVSVDTQGMLLGASKAQITFSARDSRGIIQGSSQVVAVTVNVLG